ncbi:hypothetical protein [Flavobacterium hungaricum]|uniref:Uncharacterized protein n=1 Tax=Flavobacterium hungaricum TaxID=2082725 RepID=A0ABR9TM94_9FLAO|nr:hypothetical protein [Flavobacterium hungaricum]MBE8726479.1 hypothetical protein [Flavobacterium hungaricum]
MKSSPDMNLINTAFQTEKPALNIITALYNRNEDEPDFDCEFLYGDTMDEGESILDPEADELNDDYNDNEWNTDLYDPYLEQTYY